MKRPDFIGLGAQKAGTSWIHAGLYEHPQIYMPPSKELHFFSNYFTDDPSGYDAQFRDCHTSQLAGEFSPTYLYHPEAPKRIHNYHPNMKLLICLRDPLARTISAYRYAIQMGHLPPTARLVEVVQEQPAYLEHSLYHAQIKRYLQYFQRDQILLTLYEDIALSPHAFMHAIYRFLGVDPNFYPTTIERKVNVGRGTPRSWTADRLLRNIAKSLRQAGLAHWVWRLGQSRAVEMLRQINTRPFTQPPLSEAERTTLYQFFASDVQALSDLLGRDLSGTWPAYKDIPVS